MAAAALAGPAQAASLHLGGPSLDVTVAQGGTSDFGVPLTAGGAISCITQVTPALVEVQSLYSVDAAGDVAAGHPADVPFSGDNERGASDNCDVTWDGAPDPYQLTLTATAASDTPIGDYASPLAYEVMNAPNTGPAGKLGSGGAVAITIHVVAAEPVVEEPPAAIPPAAQVVLGIRVTPLRPTLGKTELLTLVSGAVTYRKPSGNALALGKQPVLVPNGTKVDVRNGVVKVTVERDASGELDSVDAWGGTFVVNQPGGVAPATTFTLSGQVLTGPANSARVSRKRGARKVQLWMNGKGNFKTKGKRASAIVRGTYWLTEETVGGTAVVVKRGVVAVRDFGTKKTTLVTAGHSYLARIKARLSSPRFTG